MFAKRLISFVSYICSINAQKADVNFSPYLIMNSKSAVIVAAIVTFLG